MNLSELNFLNQLFWIDSEYNIYTQLDVDDGLLLKIVLDLRFFPKKCCKQFVNRDVIEEVLAELIIRGLMEDEEVELLREELMTTWKDKLDQPSLVEQMIKDYLKEANGIGTISLSGGSGSYGLTFGDVELCDLTTTLKK